MDTGETIITCTEVTYTAHSYQSPGVDWHQSPKDWFYRKAWTWNPVAFEDLEKTNTAEFRAHTILISVLYPNKKNNYRFEHVKKHKQYENTRIKANIYTHKYFRLY